MAGDRHPWSDTGKRLDHSETMKDGISNPNELSATNSPCSRCSIGTGRREFLANSLGPLVALASLSMFLPVSEIVALSASSNPSEAGPNHIAARVSVSYPIPTADGVSIDKTHDLMICRSDSSLFAFALACPHQNTALRALPGVAGFQCPRHKSRYQPNGTFVSGRATRNMDRLPISREGDVIEVNVDVAIRSDKEPQKWAAAMVKL